MNAPCPSCEHIHVAGDVIAVGKFVGLSGYRTPDGTIYETREDAQAALCQARQQGGVA